MVTKAGLTVHEWSLNIGYFISYLMITYHWESSILVKGQEAHLNLSFIHLGYRSYG